MARYQAILAYDGTDFRGFQRQAEARTVQAVFETALSSIGWRGNAILAAGRTDTGVHAIGQVVAFDLDWGHPPEDLLEAVNAHLPVDVAARSVKQVSQDFHPRYSAVSRRYRYRIFCDPIRRPLNERYSWRIWPNISTSDLLRSADLLVGEHDFSAFGTPPRDDGSTIRRIFSASWFEDGSELIFEISGNAFLYRMVRRLVSCQVEMAQGSRSIDDLHSLLTTKTGHLIQGLAPAHGLTLVEVVYPEGIAGESLSSSR
jgi:tRNA pseudouridine38-40 synthase